MLMQDNWKYAIRIAALSIFESANLEFQKLKNTPTKKRRAVQRNRITPVSHVCANFTHFMGD